MAKRGLVVVRTRFYAALSGACLISSTLAFQAAVPRIAALAANSITFSTPTLADANHANGEPDIGIDPQGRVFSSGPTGTGTQRSMWYGSTDGGHSFSQISAGPVPSTLSGTTQPPGGGDTEIKFDHTGKQYFADLYALACLRTAVTSDGGATVQQGIAGGCEGTGPGADRQWISVFDPPGGKSKSPYNGPLPLSYMDYNDLGVTSNYPNGGSQWNKSTNGLDYFQAIAGQPPATAVAGWAPFGPDGYPAIDQVTGDVFQAAGFKNPDGTYSMLLNIGTPDSTGNLTFLDQSNATAATPLPPSALLIHIADSLPTNPDTLFSVLSMDSARNLVVVWASAGTPAQRQTFVSAASAASGWTSWTKPVQVSSAPSMVSVFPWIKAGGPGRADAVWYGSNSQVDLSTDSGQAWDVYMAQVAYPVDSTGSITGAAPSVTEVKATPRPMHYNSICLLGTDCITKGGNRNLADFFAVTVDKTGAAEIVYDDTSNGLIQQGFSPPLGTPQLVDHSGAPIVTIVRQASGLGVFGTPVSGPSNAPQVGITDRSGDARYPLISGRNVPALDILNSSITLANGVLSVRTQVADLSTTGIAAAVANTAVAGSPATNLQYVTRWKLGDTIYYAAMETTAGVPTYYAGAAKSVDLCSVSACFPHVITYPEPAWGGSQETGSISCPAQPSAANPCTLTVQVNAADVGAPTNSSLLEEVGAYSFASAVQSGEITNAQAQADNVPLEIDGACCYNTKPPTSAPLPCHAADGQGNVHSQDGRSGSFTSDEDPCEDGNSPGEQFSDSSGHSFHSASVDGVSFDDAAGTMTVTGTGTDNGVPVTYTIVELQGGALVGTYSLVLSDGYTFAGTIVSGAIQLS